MSAAAAAKIPPSLIEATIMVYLEQRRQRKEETLLMTHPRLKPRDTPRRDVNYVSRGIKFPLKEPRELETVNQLLGENFIPIKPMVSIL